MSNGHSRLILFPFLILPAVLWWTALMLAALLAICLGFVMLPKGEKITSDDAQTEKEKSGAARYG